MQCLSQAHSTDACMQPTAQDSRRHNGRVQTVNRKCRARGVRVLVHLRVAWIVLGALVHHGAVCAHCMQVHRAVLHNVDGIHETPQVGNHPLPCGGDVEIGDGERRWNERQRHHSGEVISMSTHHILKNIEYMCTL